MQVSRVTLAVVGAALVAGTVGAAVPAGAAGPPDRLTVAAGGALGQVVTGPGQLALGGGTEVSVGVARRDGGQARVVAGPGPALPRAISFPSFAPSGAYPRAVVTLVPRSGGALAPGGADFTYGAVLRTSGSGADRAARDGDNVFQRGRHGDPSMFKLQVDGGHASCVVKGLAGRVVARSSVRVPAGVWHRIACSRAGSRVTVEVTRYGDGDVLDRTVVTRPTGSVAFHSSTPASIGGKLRASGGLAGATDQFNGDVATVWASRG